ncbi:NAD(P)H-dependent oxidoreductase [Gracilibacillus sp. YIM 98692]|uniref:NAD(P)H-dependent oxidoreductase n=1 Tax=Gracilibacillus sp. YIM 98692 TaxID=2663532 RepID=UPI0013D2CFFA|nr:NAD(P)H-dependent oxidoreductase [Gracilibacillus sp. YIM 98692]
MKNKEQIKQSIIDAYYFRHATKQFDPNKKIPEDDFQFIMETAHLSPSSFGMEPWRFLVIENEALREKIKNISWGARGKVMDASHFVILLSRTQKDTQFDSDYANDHYKNVLGFPEEAADGLLGMIENFQKSDFELIEDERRMEDWASKQTYIALGNMMTAAAQIGIDSCPIEGFSIKKMNQFLIEEGLLEDGNFSISAMAAFGYRLNEPKAKTRRPFDNIVKWVK